LQRADQLLPAVGVFVATACHWRCAFLRRALLDGSRWRWDLSARVFSFYGSMLLVFEARLALEHHARRMDFIWRTTKRSVPPENWSNNTRHITLHFRKKNE